MVFCLVLIGSVDTFSPHPKLSLVFLNRPHSQNFHCREILSKLVGKSSLLIWEPSFAPGVLMLTCTAGSQLRTSENKRRKTLWNVISTWYMPDRKETSPFCKKAGLSLHLSPPSKQCQEGVVVGVVVYKEGQEYLKAMPYSRKAAWCWNAHSAIGASTYQPHGRDMVHSGVIYSLQANRRSKVRVTLTRHMRNLPEKPRSRETLL